MTEHEVIEAIDFLSEMCNDTENVGCGYMDDCRKCEYRMAMDAILKQHKYRWHDLRKNPEDLPEQWEKVLVWHEYYHWSQDKVLPEYGLGYVCGGELAGKWGGEITNGRDVKIIAWRYIEPFEEADE